MRKFRKDAKPISLPLAMKLYWDGGALREVAQLFKVDHTNLISRFRRFNIPIKTKSEAKKGMRCPWLEGELNYGWKGGYTLQKTQGYISNNRTKKRLHREIAEKVLGRPMKRTEVAHHVDGNGANNKHSNLIICTQSYHGWLHAKLCGGMIGQNYNK